MGLYLDYNASTPIDNAVLDYMIEIYRNNYGNAESRTHSYGSSAKKVVEKARNQVAELLNIRKNEVIFTSGSTESNNMAVLGLKREGIKRSKNHIITTAIEHKSVLEPMKKLIEEGFIIDVVYPQRSGRIDVQQVLSRIRKDTLLVSVMHVNNETGTIQPVEELGEALQDLDVFFHVDASQSCGKLVNEIQRLKYDLLSISAHKMYGPQGIGAIITKINNGKMIPVEPLMLGGGQEAGLRPGTLPVALIAGFGLACELSHKNHLKYQEECFKNQKRLIQILDTKGIKYSINGKLEYSIGNTLNISFAGIDSEVFMLISRDHIGVSNGSACTSSYEYKPSYVLQAMGLEEKKIGEAIRISWGKNPIDFDELESILKWVKEEQDEYSGVV